MALLIVQKVVVKIVELIRSLKTIMFNDKGYVGF